VHYSRLAGVLVVVFPWLAACQTAILQIRVVEGEGGIHAAGSRNTRPISVEVTDETGKPLEHAAVSFHLPGDGPGGVFPNGLRTEVAITDSAGRAAVRGISWNRIPGRFQLRIVASYEQARAGITSSQYIEGPELPAVPATTATRHHGSRWLWIGALAAAGAAGGILAGHGGTKAEVPAASPSAAPTLGTPSISVTKP
jgi:hypothetical protein